MAGVSIAVCSTSSPASAPSSALFSASARSARSFHARALGKPCLAHHRSAIPRVVCAAAVEESAIDVGRRQACLGMATLLAASAGMAAAKPEGAMAREVEVGSYLPASPDDPRFVQFRATAKDTPALRAGNFLSALVLFVSLAASTVVDVLVFSVLMVLRF